MPVVVSRSKIPVGSRIGVVVMGGLVATMVLDADVALCTQTQHLISSEGLDGFDLNVGPRIVVTAALRLKYGCNTRSAITPIKHVMV